MFGVKIKKTCYFLFLFLFFLGPTSAHEQVADFNEQLNLAYSYQNTNSDSVLFYAREAIAMAVRMKQPDLYIDVLKLIIKTQIKNGKLIAAINNCMVADSIAQINNLTGRQVEILMFKGLVYQSSGFDSEGLMYFLNASELMIETGDDKYKSELDYYLAVTYYSMKEFVNCREFANQAIAEELGQGDSTSVLKSYLLISSSFLDADSIYKYLVYAEAFCKKRQDSYKYVILQNNKAIYYKSIGDLNMAKTSYLEAIRISISYGYKEHLSNLFNNYAYLLMKVEKFDSAKLVLEEALFISRSLKNIDIEASVLDSYSDYLVAIGDSSLSFSYYKQAVKLRNDYRKKQQIEKSLLLSIVFESKKKENEIARTESKLYRTNNMLLIVVFMFFIALAVIIIIRQISSKRKTKIKSLEHKQKLVSANAMIKGQDVERKRIAMDLHDGISSKVGALMLMLNKSYKKTLQYPQISESIFNIDQDIRDISHRLIPPNLEQNGLKSAIEHYISSLKQSTNLVVSCYLNLKIRPPEYYEVNIYFIIYELINNVVKHANASKLAIQLYDIDNKISISVEDNGVGFNLNDVGTGIGLKNVQHRVSYLNGVLSVDSVRGESTAIFIEIKLP